MDAEAACIERKPCSDAGTQQPSTEAQWRAWVALYDRICTGEEFDLRAEMKKVWVHAEPTGESHRDVYLALLAALPYVHKLNIQEFESMQRDLATLGRELFDCQYTHLVVGATLIRQAAHDRRLYDIPELVLLLHAFAVVQYVADATAHYFETRHIRRSLKDPRTEMMYVCARHLGNAFTLLAIALVAFDACAPSLTHNMRNLLNFYLGDVRARYAGLCFPPNFIFRYPCP